MWPRRIHCVSALFVFTLAACNAAVDFQHLPLPPLPEIVVPEYLELRPLTDDSPLENPNLQIVEPFLVNQQPVLQGTLLGTTRPVSPWRYLQWNNSRKITGYVATGESNLYLDTAHGQLRKVRAATPTALLELVRNDDGADFGVRLGGNNSEQFRSQRLLDGPCHHAFGGTNYFLFQDMPHFLNGQQPFFWGWLASFQLGIEEVRLDSVVSPCRLNLGQVFLGIIFKTAKNDPHTVFYQIHLSDTRPQQLNDFNHIVRGFANSPETCLLGRGANQYQTFPATAPPNRMLIEAEKQTYTLLLPLEQLQEDLKKCFPEIPAADWAVESLYYGLELDGISALRVFFNDFRFQTVWHPRSRR